MAPTRHMPMDPHSLIFLDYCVAAICMMSAWISHEDTKLKLAGRAYILHNQVTHSRLLPAASKHSFVYPTLSLLLSLDALEKRQLDLSGGWLFSYGGIWGRVTGLRASGYLHDSPQDERSIRQKLVDVLDQRGWPGSNLRDAWLMTMPSFLGVEGINPLTVYFCYQRGEPSLWLVVLEIHNTFGERNVHVLETGKSEDAHQGSGFEHQWTFPRQFHVSPFNDRSGHYICQINAPSHPPRPPEAGSLHPPRPLVKITLLSAPPHAQTKLVAVLRATRSTPLSSASLFMALARAPLGLLLAFPRIAYQAFLLHYYKRLNVYQRPEPHASDPAVEASLPAVQNMAQENTDPVGGGIGWQKEGFLERWCKHRVHAFLCRRCAETGTSVIFVSANPFEEQIIISPPGKREISPSLSICYRSPRLFTILYMMPSPSHALLFGSQAEKVFAVSSEDLFSSIFAAWSASRQLSRTTRLTRRIRMGLVPDSIDLPIPLHHPLDDQMGIMSVLVLAMLWILATLEEKIFKTLGARFVPGDEPWGGWSRLHSGASQRPGGGLGSVRREEGS